MTDARALADRIKARGVEGGIDIEDALAANLADYVELLARWNRKINLTSLDLDPPSDEAIDRLVLEPVAAAKYVRDEEHSVIDVGSGGGSPALPLKMALPRLTFTLVESKTRKAAFLREAARHLRLANVAVDTRRVQELGEIQADLVTIRAVRVDTDLLASLERIAGPDARVLLFGSIPDGGAAHPLVGGSVLTIRTIADLVRATG